MGGIVVLLVAVGLILFLSTWREKSIQSDTKSRTDASVLGPRVQVAHVTLAPPEHAIILEGDARPYSSVTLYAKLSGYLKRITVDKGDRVSEGQVVAIIESPETDRQYLAALADSKNKAKIAARNRQLLTQQLVSAQQSEQSDADEEVSKETLAGLEQLKSYETIRAPFSGTVTARYADPGALLQNAANSQSSSLPIIALAQLNRLRIDVYLDQRYATFVHVGDSAEVMLAEKPGFVLNARVTRYTGALDPATRMLLVELEVPNSSAGGAQIVAGSTVQVKLNIVKPSGLTIPSSALIVRSGPKGTKYFVPIVDAANRAIFHEVKIGENDGDVVQILSGLTGGERLALNLGETLADSSHVQPIDEVTPAH